MNLKRALTIIFVVFLITFAALTDARKMPELYGKVLLKTSSGEKPLKQVEIWLLDVVQTGEEDETKPGEMLHRRYSDFKGNYAFYNIKKNRKYYLKVVIGRKGEQMLPDEVNIMTGEKKIKNVLIEVGTESTKKNIVVEM